MAVCACYANEDDNVSPTQSLHGAGPDLLGLQSAVHAADALLVSEPASPDADTWRAQAALWNARPIELQSAIDALYNADGKRDGLFAESWKNYSVGSSVKVVPLNDEPHVWEHALYYMTALCAFPPAS